MAPNDYKLGDDEVSVFLAGGITNCPDWQTDIIKRLELLPTDKLAIFNPRRENFPIHDPSAAFEQIKWEFDYLDKIDIFSMYFSSGISDQPICMYELGRNVLRMQNRFPTDWEDRIIVSVEDGYKRKQDVLIQLGLACKNKILLINTGTDDDITKGNHAEMIARAYEKIRM